VLVLVLHIHKLPIVGLSITPSHRVLTQFLLLLLGLLSQLTSSLSLAVELVVVVLVVEVELVVIEHRLALLVEELLLNLR
jgi:hypothetical protein